MILSMSEMYTKHAIRYAEAVKENIYNALFERPSTLSLLDNVKGKDVIDMGCGSGVYAEWLIKQSVNRLTCVDVSEQMISLIKKNLGTKVNAYKQDISFGLPYENNNSADVILSPLVLHYIENLKPVFESVYRVLKPGGYMVFSMHHPFTDFKYSQSSHYFERESIEEEWDTIGFPVSVRFYRRSLTEISEAITSSGLMISKISEGTLDEKAKQINQKIYSYLKNNPNFIFIRCEKSTR